jgi:hypothetical protein
VRNVSFERFCIGFLGFVHFRLDVLWELDSSSTMENMVLDSTSLMKDLALGKYYRLYMSSLSTCLSNNHLICYQFRIVLHEPDVPFDHIRSAMQVVLLTSELATRSTGKYWRITAGAAGSPARLAVAIGVAVGGDGPPRTRSRGSSRRTWYYTRRTRKRPARAGVEHGTRVPFRKACHVHGG